MTKGAHLAKQPRALRAPSADGGGLMREWRAVIGIAVIGVVGVGLGFTGCHQPAAPVTPEVAYERFSTALRSRDAKSAWETLSTPTRTVLAQRSKAIAAASQGVIRDDPQSMVLQSGVKPREISGVRLVSASGDAAVLEVVSDSGTQQVKMVKEGALWLVDLSDTLLEAARRD